MKGECSKLQMWHLLTPHFDKTECTDYHAYFEIYYLYDCTLQIAKPFIVKGKKKSLRNVRNLTEKLALREYGQFFIHLCHSLVLLTMPFLIQLVTAM